MESVKQKRNTDPKFAGTEQIKIAQRKQLSQFEEAANARQWRKIHHSHYDWWMFPVDSPSSYGLKWTVYRGDIEELKSDQNFVRNYLRGVEILMTSWGWDLYRKEFLANPATDQKWQGWPVRLYKAAYSLWLFGCEKEFISLRRYALSLIERGEDMRYGTKDLAGFFIRGLNPYTNQQLYQSDSLN